MMISEPDWTLKNGFFPKNANQEQRLKNYVYFLWFYVLMFEIVYAS